MGDSAIVKLCKNIILSCDKSWRSSFGDQRSEMKEKKTAAFKHFRQRKPFRQRKHPEIYTYTINLHIMHICIVVLSTAGA